MFIQNFFVNLVNNKSAVKNWSYIALNISNNMFQITLYFLWQQQFMHVQLYISTYKYTV